MSLLNALFHCVSKTASCCIQCAALEHHVELFQGFLFSPARWNLCAQPKQLCMMSFTASRFLLAFQLSRWLLVLCTVGGLHKKKNMTTAQAKLVTWVLFNFSCLAYFTSSARSFSKMVAFLTLTSSQINVDLASDGKASSWLYA